MWVARCAPCSGRGPTWAGLRMAVEKRWGLGRRARSGAGVGRGPGVRQLAQRRAQARMPAITRRMTGHPRDFVRIPATTRRMTGHPRRSGRCSATARRRRCRWCDPPRRGAAIARGMSRDRRLSDRTSEDHTWVRPALEARHPYGRPGLEGRRTRRAGASCILLPREPDAGVGERDSIDCEAYTTMLRQMARGSGCAGSIVNGTGQTSGPERLVTKGGEALSPSTPVWIEGKSQ